MPRAARIALKGSVFHVLKDFMEGITRRYKVEPVIKPIGRPPKDEK